MGEDKPIMWNSDVVCVVCLPSVMLAAAGMCAAAAAALLILCWKVCRVDETICQKENPSICLCMRLDHCPVVEKVPIYKTAKPAPLKYFPDHVDGKSCSFMTTKNSNRWCSIAETDSQHTTFSQERVARKRRGKQKQLTTHFLTQLSKLNMLARFVFRICFCNRLGIQAAVSIR